MNKKIDDIQDNNREVLKELEELNLEQTEKLLEEINKVTLSKNEIKKMNKKLLKKLKREKVGIISQEERTIKARKRKIDFKSSNSIRRVGVLIAVIMTFSVVAIATTNMESLLEYFGDDTEIYLEDSLENIQSVENKDLRINVDGIVSDKYQCFFVLSVEALTKDGKKIIKEATKDKHYVVSDFEIKYDYIIEEKGNKGYGIFEYGDYNKKNDYKAYKCHFELENVDLLKPVFVELLGLTMELDIPEPMQMITLYPEKESNIKCVELSPIGFYYINKDLDLEEFGSGVSLIKMDGELDEEVGYQCDFPMETDENQLIIGEFRKIIDLNNYKGIRVDGIDYTVNKKSD